MKRLFLLFILAIGTPVFAYYVTDTSDNAVYNVTPTYVVAPNGDMYQRMGNTTYTKDNVYRREGDYTYGNDGSIYRHYNNLVIPVVESTDNLRLYSK